MTTITNKHGLPQSIVDAVANDPYVGGGDVSVTKLIDAPQIMQLTRQRMKPEMNINTQEQCPSCQGTGKISSTLVLEDEIEKNISYLSEQKHKSLTIAVHPILYAYLTKGIISKRRKWAWKYKMKLDIRENSTYHLTEFHFFDNHDEEIRL